MRLESIAKHFKLWEILADLEQLLPDIRESFEALAPSFDLKFAVHAPFNDLNIASFNPKIRKISLDTIKESMTVAHELGIRIFSFHPGHYCPTGLYYPEKVFELSKKGVWELEKFAKNLDLEVSLENMPIPKWTLCTNKDELMEYIEGTDLKICFDIGHAHINNQIFEFMKVIDLFGNVHIHDNNGKRDQHRIIGTETVPLKDFLKDLIEGYNDNIIIEANTLEEGVESYEVLKKMINDIE
ncbi:MAG: sugar phosphate isomerase/epimerase [Thermoplasmata archaeon]|nr:MAG: sugar phosphate isomerase/epimerase [Thermoplasmata archaeon]